MSQDLTNGNGARQRISAAARELFASQGYQQTTVEAIAERAGVGRRTFFRHFRSKDEVILPDHDRVVEAMERRFADTYDLSPVRGLCQGVRVVFRSYVDEPVLSVQRYRLTRSVPELRARELAMVQEYFKAFRRYLVERFAQSPPRSAPDAGVRADVIAGAVVSAHNQVLRDWLRAGGVEDPMPTLDAVFAWLVQIFEVEEGAPELVSTPTVSDLGTGDSVEAGSGAAVEPGESDVVVAVFRVGEPLPEVMRRIAQQL
jgi:AcrR family transcriptional regulator